MKIFIIIPITNVCIAKCTFCAIWKQKPKVFVAKEKALLAIDKLADLGVSHITLTGGEPLMHPNIIAFVSQCTSRNIYNTVLDAAPSLITDDRLDLLDQAGNDMISISFDSEDPKVLEESRQIPHIMRDVEDAVKRIKRTRIKSMASILIWNNNHDQMEKVFAKATDMGFDLISISYPTFAYSGASRSRFRDDPGQHSEMKPVTDSDLKPVTDSDLKPVTFWRVVGTLTGIISERFPQGEARWTTFWQSGSTGKWRDPHCPQKGCPCVSSKKFCDYDSSWDGANGRSPAVGPSATAPFTST